MALSYISFNLVHCCGYVSSLIPNLMYFCSFFSIMKSSKNLSILLNFVKKQLSDVVSLCIILNFINFNLLPYYFSLSFYTFKQTIVIQFGLTYIYIIRSFPNHVFPPLNIFPCLEVFGVLFIICLKSCLKQIPQTLLGSVLIIYSGVQSYFPLSSLGGTSGQNLESKGSTAVSGHVAHCIDENVFSSLRGIGRMPLFSGGFSCSLNLRSGEDSASSLAF